MIEETLAIRTQEMEFFFHKDEFIIIPRGIEHSPMSFEEILEMLIALKTY